MKLSHTFLKHKHYFNVIFTLFLLSDLSYSSVLSVDIKQDLKTKTTEKKQSSPAVKSLKEKLASPGKNLYKSGDLRSEVVEYILLRYKSEIEENLEFKSLSKQEIAKQIVSLKGINYDNIWFWNPDELPAGLVYFYDDRDGDKILSRSFDTEKKKIIYKDENGERVKKRFVKIGLQYLGKSGNKKIKSLMFDGKTGFPINIFQEKATIEGKGIHSEFGENLEIETLVSIDINGELYGLFVESKLPAFGVSVTHPYSYALDQKEFDAYELSAIEKGVHQDSIKFKVNDLLRDKKISVVSKISVDQQSVSQNAWVSRKTVHIHFDSLDEVKKYIEQISTDLSNTIKLVSISGNKELSKILSKWNNWRKYSKFQKSKSQGDISLAHLSSFIQVNSVFRDIRIFVADLKNAKSKKEVENSQRLNILFHDLQNHLMDNNWFDYYLNLKTSPLHQEVVAENIKLFTQLSILKAFDTLNFFDKSACIVDYSRSKTSLIRYSFLITQVVIERFKKNGSLHSQSLNDLRAIGIDESLLFENIFDIKNTFK